MIRIEVRIWLSGPGRRYGISIYGNAAVTADSLRSGFGERIVYSCTERNLNGVD